MSTPAITPQPVMTVKQVAAHLSVDEDHVRRLIRDGRLHAFRVGTRQFRITASSVDRFISGNGRD